MGILDQLNFVFGDFFAPDKRVFVGYLFLSLLIAFAWLIFVKRQSASRAFARILDAKVFFSNSAIADYKIFIVNQLFSWLVSPLLLAQLTIATGIYFALHGQSLIPFGHFSGVDKSVVVTLFTLTLFVIDDFTKYLVHRWMHRFRVLWAIHKVHHSAKTLTPVTVYRVHPLEGVLYATRGTVAQGAAISLFIFLFGSAINLYTVLGANVLVFIFHVTGSNLRHSHINISYWPWLERIFISPAQHQLHHSIAEEHFDKNFGAALAVWDWLFGSLHLSQPEQDKVLEFGLDPSEGMPEADLRSIYLAPLFEIARIIQGGFAKVMGNTGNWIASLAGRGHSRSANAKPEEQRL